MPPDPSRILAPAALGNPSLNLLKKFLLSLFFPYWKMISHEEINEISLNGRGLHLNKRGTVNLAKDFKQYLTASNWSLVTRVGENGKNTKLPKVRGFKLVSLNIVSLPLHIEEQRLWSAEQDIDLLLINETRLDSSISNLYVFLNNYNLYF